MAAVWDPGLAGDPAADVEIRSSLTASEAGGYAEARALLRFRTPALAGTKVSGGLPW